MRKLFFLMLVGVLTAQNSSFGESQLPKMTSPFEIDYLDLPYPDTSKYKGKVKNIVFKLIGGLKSSMGYLGSKQIKYLRNKPQFVKITKAGFYESMVHNVDIIKSDNKY